MSSMIRFPDWQSRFDAFLRESRDKQFAWGSWDCCLWVGGALQSMTGVDLAAPFRGRYSSRVEGRKLLHEAGGVEAIFFSAGMPEIPVTHARRGDVVMFRKTLIGIVALNGMDALVIGEKGLTTTPKDTAIKAWHV